jgi:hypothetical protein
MGIHNYFIFGGLVRLSWVIYEYQGESKSGETNINIYGGGKEEYVL